MPAAKANYIVCYKQSAQVYSATNLSTAIKSPVPKGCKLEDRVIMFTSFLPDTLELCVFPLTDEQLQVEEDKLEANIQTG
jgi:hypothetical protein